VSGRGETRIGSRTFRWGERTYLMGILNVTPDSFSGDGLLTTNADPVARAVQQAARMLDEGADLLDVGGESTRPGHAAVGLEEELERVIPVIRAVRQALGDPPITIDTTKPEVAEAALAAGASAINDVWGVSEDDGLARVAATHGAPIVVMHNRAEPIYRDLLAEVIDDLRRGVAKAVRAGVPESDVLIDPGIGFGKTAAQNLELLRHLGRLREIGRPILLGTSRKSTIGKVLDLPEDERVEGTLATTALGIAQGVDIVRVHDVLENARAARMSDAVVRGWPAP
jgi:dihydropteroate synthase